MARDSTSFWRLVRDGILEAAFTMIALGLLGAVVGGGIAWWRFGVIGGLFGAIAGAIIFVAVWLMSSVMK